MAEALYFSETCLLGFAVVTLVLLAVRQRARPKLLQLIRHHDYASVPMVIGAGIAMPLLAVWCLYLNTQSVYLSDLIINTRNTDFWNRITGPYWYEYLGWPLATLCISQLFWMRNRLTPPGSQDEWR